MARIVWKKNEGTASQNLHFEAINEVSYGNVLGFYLAGFVSVRTDWNL